jgi:hypothetical protein
LGSVNKEHEPWRLLHI